MTSASAGSRACPADTSRSPSQRRLDRSDRLAGLPAVVAVEIRAGTEALAAELTIINGGGYWV